MAAVNTDERNIKSQMIYRITFAVMLTLAIWTAFAAFRIERMNAEAGYYLPRHDHDGQWRVSRESTPRDQLRGLIVSAGLLQYLLAPLLVGLASVHLARRESAMQRFLALGSGVVGLAALSLALYRGYYSSLGW